MRGGGTRGIYELGALEGFLDTMDAEEIQYDVIAGVSSGSLNGAPIALYEKGKEAKAFEFIHKDWFNSIVNKSTVFDQWPIFGPLATYWKPSFTDFTPMHEKGDSVMKNKQLHRRVAFQSVDINTGKVHTFTEAEPKELYGEMVVASASLALMFQPVTSFAGMTMQDGGDFSFINL